MLNVVFFTFNPFEENTYIISNELKQCWIVDPGMYYPEEVKMFTNYIQEKQLQPQGIINTHAHLDHIFGVQALMDKYSIPFAMHQSETPVLERASDSAAMFGVDLSVPPTPDFYIKETEPLKLGDDTLEVRFTPGHSPGSISFYYAPGNWVISGDVLFAGGIGRTDLPGGNFDTLIKSIKTQLFTLPGNTQVLSGHGVATHIDEEKKYNPYLR
jgi:glyoxylase-like metal-dependent hydrolase (beta-lactamase superfamily II)